MFRTLSPRSVLSLATAALALALPLAASSFDGPRDGEDSPRPLAVPEVRSAAVEPRLARVAVLGASLSAGYGLRSELEVKADFSDILAAALTGPVEVEGFGALSFFAQPNHQAQEQLAKARDYDPTAIFGLDFLFWFAYGDRPESERASFFELGLMQLASLEIPLVLGDLPDMRFALEGEGPFGMGPVIRSEMIPSAATLDVLNARLREWAAERPQVVLVPFAEHVRRLHGETALELRGNRWAPADFPQLFQEDLLHPTVAGDVCTALLALDAMDRAKPLTEGAVIWKADQVEQALLEATRAEREENRERERRREERRRQREKKKAEKKGEKVR